MVPACLVPKKFLCSYSLTSGAILFAILFIVLKLASIVCMILRMMAYSQCESCPRAMLRCAYGFGGTVMLQYFITVFIHLWFIMAVKKGVSSVVIVWVVVSELWWIQTVGLMIVMLCLYLASASFIAWVMGLIIGIIMLAIAQYGILIGYGLWLEMKSTIRGNTQAIN